MIKLYILVIGGLIMTHFKGKQFKQDIILVAVGYYLRYNLSYRMSQKF